MLNLCNRHSLQTAPGATSTSRGTRCTQATILVLSGQRNGPASPSIHVACSKWWRSNTYVICSSASTGVRKHHCLPIVLRDHNAHPHGHINTSYETQKERWNTNELIMQKRGTNSLWRRLDPTSPQMVWIVDMALEERIVFTGEIQFRRFFVCLLTSEVFLAFLKAHWFENLKSYSYITGKKKHGLRFSSSVWFIINEAIRTESNPSD